MVSDTVAVPLKIASTAHFYCLLDENDVEISQYNSIQEMIQTDSVTKHRVERNDNESTAPIISAATSLFDVINE